MKVFYAVMACLFLVGCHSANAQKKNGSITSKDVEDAFIYGYPLVLMDATKNVMTDTPDVTEDQAPINQFLNMKEFPTPEMTDVVSPNSDTLYSAAWLDLAEEPIILSVPDMGKRYYLMPILDMWTNVIAAPGTRTTGNGKGAFAIVGPNWTNPLPKDVKEIRSPTDYVWIIGRTQTNGTSDYAAVNKIQDQYKLTPLSAWGTNYVPPTDVPIDEDTDVDTPPVEQVNEMDGVTFFSILGELLKDAPPPPSNRSILPKLAAIGLIPGQDFNEGSLTDEQRSAINQGVKAAKDRIAAEWKSAGFTRKVNNWGILQKTGNYGDDYFLRAVVAYGGLGANLPEDALYPVTRVDSDGKPLTGKNRYVVHFDKSQLPPVKGFWSITMYNDKQFFVENPINRYAIGTKDQLKTNSDGSLDIYMQHDSPGKDKESNWLPAPDGDFNLILRLYWPEKQILDGTWKPPFVKKVG